MGLGTDLRKQYLLQAAKGGHQLLKVVAKNLPASSTGEHLKQFAIGKQEGTAFSILREAMVKIKKAEEKYENVNGWVRLDGTFMHDYRNRRGPQTKSQFNDCYDTLKDAKIAYMNLQKHKDERERPKGITFYEQKYGFRFSIRTDISGSNETSWYRVHGGGVDKRGSRASLWATKTIKYTPPRNNTLTGRHLLASGHCLHSFMHDELDGSINGLGFLWACQVMGEGKYKLSVDGSQDNTQSLMSQAIHVYFNDRGTNGAIGLDNSVPMAILAVLATHNVASIPNFPKISQSHFGKGKSAQEHLQKGDTAGSMGALHRFTREETDESKDWYGYHIGGFLSRAVESVFAFLNNHELEQKTRFGVGVYKNLRPLDDYTMPPDPSVVAVSDDAKLYSVPIVTLDNRFLRKLPRPIDFSCDRYTLHPSSTVAASELVELGSFPLLGAIQRAQVTTSPPLPASSTPEDMIQFYTDLHRRKAKEEKTAQELKQNDKKRPKLPLPIPLNESTAQSPIGAAMIKRFEQSSVDYQMRLAQIERESYVLQIDSQTKMLALYRECSSLLKQSVESVRREAKEIEYHLNRNTSQPTHSDNCGYVGVTGFLRHQLMKASWLEPHVEMPLLLGSVLASDGIRQVRDANPLLDEATAKELIDRAALLMLRTSRVSQLRRTIREIENRCPFVVSGTTKNGGSMSNMSALVSSIGRNITSQRHWAAILPNGGIQFDPRFLSFEFTSGYMMWERQTQLIRDFYNAAMNGSSETQQMIMGDGKTTVVGPMLTLMLGGARGVTVVCPRALIVQTKQIMRQIFSAPLTPKPVLTLKFDRGHDSRVSALRAVREKLEGAHDDLGIVIASPTSIKSYFLKYVELLVMLQSNRNGGREKKNKQNKQNKHMTNRGEETKTMQPMQPNVQQQQPQYQLVQIQVPNGAGPGQLLQMAINGLSYQFVVPPNHFAGSVFQVQVAAPQAAVQPQLLAKKTSVPKVPKNTKAKWFSGPLTWKTGKIPITRISTRPDSNLPFVPSRVCVIPSPSAKMTLEVLEGECLPYRFPKGTVVESAWWVNRDKTFDVNDALYAERIQKGEEEGHCKNVTTILQSWVSFVNFFLCQWKKRTHV